MENTALADRIRARLEYAGKSAASASLEAGLGRSAVTDILSGNSGSPRLSTLEKLSTVLGCSLSYLVGAENSPDAWENSDEVDNRNWPPLAGTLSISYIARLGVYLDDKALKRSLDELGDLGLTRVFGHRDLPKGWGTTPVLIGDDSMSGIDLWKGDIVTMGRPSRIRSHEAIPLRNKSTVVIKRHLSFEGIFEISIRRVVHNDNHIHFIAGDRYVDKIDDELISSRNHLFFEVGKVPDVPGNGNQNLYDVHSGSVEVLGIAVRVQKDISLGE